jgi:transcriptional regulator with XRE-family HTH domain
LEELAKRSTVSAGLLSQIERGLGNPSYATLHKIADALNLPVSTFFRFEVSPSHQMLVRKSERKKLVLQHQGFEYELLTLDMQRKFAVLRTVIHPGFDNQEFPFSHPGDEFVSVLTGRLEAHVGNEKFDLGPGDSLTFEATLQHWYRNATARPVELLGVVSPPPW